MPIPLAVPVVAGIGSLALLFFTHSAKNTVIPDTPVTPPVVPPGGGGRKTRPDPFPPGAGSATVNVSGEPGINTRTGPGTTFPIIVGNTAFNGDVVAVLETGLIPNNAQGPEEWYRIMTPSNTIGYARAIDPQGVANFANVTPPTADFSNLDDSAAAAAAISAGNAGGAANAANAASAVNTGLAVLNPLGTLATMAGMPRRPYGSLYRTPAVSASFVRRQIAAAQRAHLAQRGLGHLLPATAPLAKMGYRPYGHRAAPAVHRRGVWHNGRFYP